MKRWIYFIFWLAEFKESSNNKFFKLNMVNGSTSQGKGYVILSNMFLLLKAKMHIFCFS